MRNSKGRGQGGWKGDYIHTGNSVFTFTLAPQVLRDGTKARLVHISIAKHSYCHQDLLDQVHLQAVREVSLAAFKDQCVFLDPS